MTWFYNDSPYSEIGEYIGFVYEITNLSNNRKYIGKKNFYFSKTKTVKGKKKRFKVESDWRSYFGSNKELASDIALHGEGNFRREILRLCKSKGEFAYFEAKFQFDLNVLESDEYYNSWIMCRVHKKHLTYIRG
jgi:hypothetical protein